MCHVIMSKYIKQSKTAHLIGNKFKSKELENHILQNICVSSLVLTNFCGRTVPENGLRLHTVPEYGPCLHTDNPAAEPSHYAVHLACDHLRLPSAELQQR